MKKVTANLDFCDCGCQNCDYSIWNASCDIECPYCGEIETTAVEPKETQQKIECPNCTKKYILSLKIDYM